MGVKPPVRSPASRSRGAPSPTTKLYPAARRESAPRPLGGQCGQCGVARVVEAHRAVETGDLEQATHLLVGAADREPAARPVGGQTLLGPDQHAEPGRIDE